MYHQLYLPPTLISSHNPQLSEAVPSSVPSLHATPPLALLPRPPYTQLPSRFSLKPISPALPSLPQPVLEPPPSLTSPPWSAPDLDELPSLPSPYLATYPLHSPLYVPSLSASPQLPLFSCPSAAVTPHPAPSQKSLLTAAGAPPPYVRTLACG